VSGLIALILILIGLGRLFTHKSKDYEM